jgi:hypothetical protein
LYKMHNIVQEHFTMSITPVRCQGGLLVMHKYNKDGHGREKNINSILNQQIIAEIIKRATLPNLHLALALSVGKSHSS